MYPVTLTRGQLTMKFERLKFSIHSLLPAVEERYTCEALVTLPTKPDGIEEKHGDWWYSLLC